MNVPILYMYNPTNAAHLSEMSSGGSGWIIGRESDENIATSTVIHCDIAQLPSGIHSREIAQSIHELLLGITLPASESDTTGHVVVIAGVECTNDNNNIILPNKADLLKALGIKDKVDGILLLNETTLTAKDYAQYVTHGFCYSPTDYNEYDNDDDSDNNSNSNSNSNINRQRINDITAIMANELTDQFEFNFTDTIVVAPVLYGGCAVDGNIVAILSMRVWT
jgi:hypothetical protein